MHSVNRKNVEVLIKAGAFDGLGEAHRAQFFYKANESETTPTYLEQLVRWAIRRQDNAASAQMSIFSMSEELSEEEHPPLPNVPQWSNIERCRYEKEVIATYLSGHPLDDYKHEMRMLTNITVDRLSDLAALKQSEVRFGGLVSNCKDMLSKKGEPFGSMTIDDYNGSYELKLFGDEYTQFRNMFIDGTFIYVKGSVVTREYKDKEGNDRRFTKLRINTMFNLAGVMDRYTQCLEFKVRLSDVDELFCHNLKQLATKHKGTIPLRALVVDEKQDLSLTMESAQIRVSARGIIDELEHLSGVYDVRPQLKS